jgi:hypothetical protein
MTDDTLELIKRVNPFPSEVPAPPIEKLLQRLDDKPKHTRALPRRSRAQTSGTLTATAVSVAVVLVVIGLIAVLGHSRSHQPATPRPIQPSAGVAAALRPVTSILGVLRRPQNAADRNPALITQLQKQSHDNFDLAWAGRPELSLMRRAAVAPWGQPIYVVPFLPPTRHAVQNVPPKDRVGNAARTATVWTYPISAGSPLGSPTEIESGRDVTNMAWVHGGNRGPAANRWVMVVPDGVAKVALWPATGSISHHPGHPTNPGFRPIVVPVHGNIAAFIAHGFTRPGQEVWYGPNGTIIKRIANADSCEPSLGGCA